MQWRFLTFPFLFFLFLFLSFFRHSIIRRLVAVALTLVLLRREQTALIEDRVQFQNGFSTDVTLLDIGNNFLLCSYESMRDSGSTEKPPQLYLWAWTRGRLYCYLQFKGRQFLWLEFNGAAGFASRLPQNSLGHVLGSVGRATACQLVWVDKTWLTIRNKNMGWVQMSVMVRELEPGLAILTAIICSEPRLFVSNSTRSPAMWA